MVSQLIWASILLAMNIKPVIQLGRSSGILLHITSLPSPYGIGDLGPEAFKFIDFLVETKQKLWQILPIYQTNSPSPYSSVSAFAGHSWLISPDKLLESGLISKDDLISIDRSRFNQSYVHFHQVKKNREKILKIAYLNFKNNNSQASEILNDFFQREKYWIDDFTLFMSIKEKVTQISLLMNLFYYCISIIFG
ncbi:unnamed protein product [Rotaria sp. Silwood2]|nr:unnamed protein product [Rotaria sp. Silwood2]